MEPTKSRILRLSSQKVNEVSELLIIIGKYVCYNINMDLNPFDFKKQFSYYLSIQETSFCNTRGNLIYHCGVALQFSTNPWLFSEEELRPYSQNAILLATNILTWVQVRGEGAKEQTICHNGLEPGLVNQHKTTCTMT